MLNSVRLVVIAATLALGVMWSAGALAADGFPAIKQPRLSAPASFQEFGGIVAVTIRNSDQDTQVTVCVSDRCRRLHRQEGGVYSAAGELFRVNLRRGQRRTVWVVANNPSGGEMWGPARVRVR